MCVTFTHNEKFSSNKGNVVFFCVFVLGLGVDVNFSSGSSVTFTYGSQEPD